MSDPQTSMPQDIGPYAQAAWTYREAGWTGVIPIGYRPKLKSPPPKHYTGWAGLTPSGADVQAWVEERPHVNIGLHLPLHTYVPDFDKPGLKEQIEARAGTPFPATWTSTSRGADSRRRHYFYRAALPAGRVWMDHPLPGMDSVHIGHRYSIVWPSVHPDGGTYEWFDPAGELYEGVPRPEELAELPAALIEAMSKPGTPMPGSAADDDTTQWVIGQFRRAPACERVSRLLTTELQRMETAKEGGSIREPGQLYALTAYGIEGHAGVAEALTVHQDTYVQVREQARGEDVSTATSDWWRQVQGAVGKRLAANEGRVDPGCLCNPPAADAPAPALEVSAEDGAVVPEVNPVDALIAEMLSAEQISSRPPPTPLIKGLLSMDSESWLIGAAGSKKSFVALDMAAHIATGRSWQKFDVTQARVIMIVAEGAAGVSKRVRAWEKAYGPMGSDIFFLPRPVQSANPAAWKVLVEACRRLAPGFVVIDTQHRVTVGLEENSATDMGVYIAAVGAVRQATGACVLTVHHTGRSGGDARGSSALDGAQDTEIKVEKKDGLRGLLKIEKQKDLEEREPFALLFERVGLGQDEAGDEITSLVLCNDPYKAAAAEVPEGTLEVDPEPWRGQEPGEWTKSYVAANAKVQRRILQVLRDHAGLRGLTKAETFRVVKDRWSEPSPTGWTDSWTVVFDLDICVSTSGEKVALDMSVLS